MENFKNAFKKEFEKNNQENFGNIFNNIDLKMKNKFRKGQKISAIIISLVFALIYFYIFLPPINIRSIETWIFLILTFTIFVAIGGKSFKYYKLLRRILVGVILLMLLLKIPGLKIFSSKLYANIIKIENSTFEKDITQLPINKIPTIDRDSSIKLGSRKMGELLDLVSQFDIDNTTYTQINYKDQPIRVTPLKYNGFIKYIFNMSQGLPGYLKVDIVNGNTELTKLDKKIKISKEDYFFRNVWRYARLRYPSEIFDNISFEIDENGIPYWVIPTYEPKIFMFDGLDVNGAILINASTGEHKKYDLNHIPKWLDRIYEADNIIEQLNWNGLYQGGYINSLFAQKNVLKTTEGYNYLALNDDVYLYTGYTSVAGDESNVGFILSNMRTKETKFYPVSSAKEQSAMESAEGAVQEKKYKSTFPLLLNIKNKPTYFLSLKDNAGLIKLYAFIDAQDYQKVSVGNTVAQALSNHLGNINTAQNNDKKDDKKKEVLNLEGKITDIKQVVIKGNTHYYFTLEGKNEIYVSNIALSEKLPFLKEGKTIKFQYEKDNINKVIIIEQIK
ncbi:hypothetical protein ABGF49_05125 [Helcococcus ovis]|nr:hypothetical protein [Helcococcus ovis]WNZ00653.1 hypothetical protein EQF90_005165 [Helcococcus ovis]